MTERSPEEEEPGEGIGPDPVNHRPPEEWRPGDPGDPASGGPQPPGEPPYESPEQGDDWWRGSPADGTGDGRTSFEGPAPGGLRPGEHPTGAPPEAVSRGESSEGPSGRGQAGHEKAGYAPGYGEADGAGGVGWPEHEPRGGGYGAPSLGDGPPPGGTPPGGYGTPPPGGPLPGGPPPPGGPAPGGPPPGSTTPGGYGPPQPTPTPWGRVLGITCSVLLVLLLLGGACTAVVLFVVGTGDTTAQGPQGTESDEDDAVPPEGAELTAAETGFEPSPFYEEGEYTSVEVSVGNLGEEDFDVNPLYFRVVDAQGEEHDTADAIAMDDNEIEARPLPPGQSISGTVTVEGDIDPETLVFEPFHMGPVEVPVA